MSNVTLTTRGPQEPVLDVISIVDLADWAIYPRLLVKEGVVLVLTRRLGRHRRRITDNTVWGRRMGLRNCAVFISAKGYGWRRSLFPQLDQFPPGDVSCGIEPVAGGFAPVPIDYEVRREGIVELPALHAAPVLFLIDCSEIHFVYLGDNESGVLPSSDCGKEIGS